MQRLLTLTAVVAAALAAASTALASPYVRYGVQDDAWLRVGATRRTDARGFYTAVVRAGRGSRLRTWSPTERAFSLTLAVG